MAKKKSEVVPEEGKAPEVKTVVEPTPDQPIEEKPEDSKEDDGNDEPKKEEAKEKSTTKKAKAPSTKELDELKIRDKIGAEKQNINIPDYADKILKQYTNEKRLYIDKSGGVFYEKTNPSFVKGVDLYENPYYEND